MQFRLSTLLLLFVVLGSSLAVFGGGGIVVFAIVVMVAISVARSMWWSFALLGFLILGLLSLPADPYAREAARRAQCMNNLRQIALALLNYRDANGCFPPAYIADANGKPMHSWRVLILPYLERADLYSQYDFNEPWDGPNNKKLLVSRPRIYACPSDNTDWASHAACTSYVAVVGANAAWSGSGPKSLAGDLSTKVMLVEVAYASIEWTEPKALSWDALVAPSPGSPMVSSRHFRGGQFFTWSDRGSHVAFADGRVTFLRGSLLPSDEFDEFPELLKVGGFREENLDANWGFAGRRIHWPNCTAFAVWLASTGWLFVRAVRSRKKAAPFAQPSSMATGSPQSGGE